MVRKQQLAQLDRIKAKQRYRKGTGTTAKLIDLKDRKKLTEIAVDAARNRTTLGEISDALETVWKIQSTN
jgi:methylmalonyl-CoA mutase